MRQIYSALTIYVLLHVSRCLVCKLNSIWRLLNEKIWKNVNFYKYLMPMIADIFDCRSNCLLTICSVYLNRGSTIYFIVSKGFP